jgi:hypothetical protein
VCVSDRVAIGCGGAESVPPIRFGGVTRAMRQVKGLRLTRSSEVAVVAASGASSYDPLPVKLLPTRRGSDRPMESSGGAR